MIEEDYRRTVTGEVRSRYLAGTSIEIIRDVRPGTRFRHVLFDFDGTLSLIREGWPEVMVPMMVDELAATGTTESRADLHRHCLDFVMRLNGKQTIYQMIRLAEEVPAGLDDGDRRAEAAPRLGELAADVAAAHDDEVRGQLRELHEPRVVEPGHALEAADRRRHRAAAHVQDHDLRAVPLAVDLDGPLADEPGLAADEPEVRAGVRDPLRLLAEAEDRQ